MSKARHGKHGERGEPGGADARASAREARSVGEMREALDALSERAELGHEAFLADRTAIDASKRDLEILGHSAEGLSGATQARYPIPQEAGQGKLTWDDLRISRNKMIHNYYEQTPESVWTKMTQDVPRIDKAVGAIERRDAPARGAEHEEVPAPQKFPPGSKVWSSALRPDSDRMADIVDSVDAMRDITEQGKGHFNASPDAQKAAIRDVEVIGEATRWTTPGTKDRNADIPWKEFTDTRNQLEPKYFQWTPSMVRATANDNKYDRLAERANELGPALAADREEVAREATEVLEKKGVDKEHIVEEPLKEPFKTRGEVLAVGSDDIAQSNGRGAFSIHETVRLPRTPEVGQDISIAYQPDGHAEVREERELHRSRSGPSR